MPKTLVGFVYDRKTLALRRIIVPDDDREVLDRRHVGADEAIVTAPAFLGHSIEHGRDAIRLATGREPPTMQEVHRMDALARRA